MTDTERNKFVESAIVITCEHGGHRVPPKYRSLFRRADTVLKSHRGWDPGSLKLAQCFAAELSAPLFAATTTRLLVELNRSLGHPQLFSEFKKQVGVELEVNQRFQQASPPQRSLLKNNLISCLRDTLQELEDQ